VMSKYLAMKNLPCESREILWGPLALLCAANVATPSGARDPAANLKSWAQRSAWTGVTLSSQPIPERDEAK
jgi:hypothetical protein